jgi:Ca-activated chloride channel family protein
MNRHNAPISLWRTLCAAGLLLLSGFAHAAGLLTPTDGSLPPLYIKDHHVTVVIEDSYAVTTVEQTFHNPHQQDLEAIYSFPVPEQGAVSEFTMWIDGKPVVGEVLEKQQARNVYEQEKKAGREAGIAEQDTYKTFDITVTPVRAGKDTRIRLVYLQSASVDTGIGRYVYPLEEGGVDEKKLAFWTANDKVTHNFGFDLKLRSSYPVEAVRVPDQSNAEIKQLNDSEWRVHLGQTGETRTTDQDVSPTQDFPRETRPAQGAGYAARLDRDIVVYWRHQAGLPGSVDLVTHKPDADKRGSFMMVVTPGDDLQAITEGRDWIFVLDISGSMRAKYATLADGVERALGKLHPDDRFRVVLFNRTARELTPGFINATKASIRKYSKAVAGIQPSDGTNLYAGLKHGLDVLEADRTSAIVLVTDGVANVGVTDQKNFVELVNKKDVRLFTFVMGNSANRPMLEAMTRASNGFAASISNSDDIAGQLLAAVSKVNHQALHGVSLSITGVKTADLAPQKIGSLYRGQQMIMFGHYWGSGNANVALKGLISGTEKVYRTAFEFPRTSTENPEIERLWAYATIRDQQQTLDNFGKNPDLKSSIVDLALEYGLVTDHTSMVVLREERFKALGIDRSNLRRTGIEQMARQQRAQRQVVSRRVDTQQPMYSSSRANHSSGSGAVDHWTILMLAPLGVIYVMFVVPGLISRRRHPRDRHMT